MKTTSLKTIYLKECELKEAIIQHLWKCGHEELAQHLNMNDCSMEWKDGKYFVVSIDGEVESEEDKSLPWYGKCAHCFGGYADQECTCKPVVSKMVTTAICDVCQRETNEYKTISGATLSGVVMCGGSMKDSCTADLGTSSKGRKEQISEVLDQITSCANKAAKQVMEEHSEALRKLAESEE